MKNDLHAAILAIFAQLTLFALYFLLISFYDLSQRTLGVFAAVFVASFSASLFYLFHRFKSKKTFFALNAIWMFLLFELFKYIQYVLGDLPKYVEQPFISASMSAIAIAIYIGFVSIFSFVITSKRQKQLGPE